jgi:3-deoxy-D-manno-octulosonic-acid transferase
MPAVPGLPACCRRPGDEPMGQRDPARLRAALLLLFYRLLLSLATPLLLALLFWRVARGKDVLARLPERLGWPSRRRPPGALVWFHAASVGELASLRPLLQALRQEAVAAGRPGPGLLVTSVTRTAAELAPQLLPAGVIHQMVPVDHWLSFALFRRHWRPRLGLLAEAELWPELLHAMPEPLLINARVSARSYRRHLRLSWFSRWLYGRCSACFAQSAADAQRLRQLGAPAALALGSTKWDAEAAATEADWLPLLRRCWSGRRVLLLASSHPGEEELLLAQWRPWCQRLAPEQLALLLVPRHPERAAAVLSAARAAGAEARLLAELQPCDGPEVVVVDRLGLMGSWIAAAELAIMGGSFRPGGRAIGGHNPLEPVRGGRPVLCGPDMANFSDLCQQLEQAGWLRQLDDGAALWPAIAHWLADPPRLEQLPAIEGPSRRIARLVLQRLDAPGGRP